MVVAGALLAILSGVMNGFFTLPMRLPVAPGLAYQPDCAR